MKHAFGRDKQYWAERHNSAKSEEETLLCLAMIENFELQEELQQARQATVDRTKELEMIKRAYNDLSEAAKGQLFELTKFCIMCGCGTDEPESKSLHAAVYGSAKAGE